MRDYKGWTAVERLASLKKTKAAIAAGTIPPPTKCNRCGKTTGRIDYHNHDYSDPIKYLEQICQGCHTRLHRMENQEIEAAKNIMENVSNDTNVVAPKNTVTKELKCGIPYGEKPALNVVGTEIKKGSANANSDLCSWLEKGMGLPLEGLVEHIYSTPAGVKPLKALRGLGIVFAGGFTKDYNCPGYPQTAGLGRNRQKFDVVVEKICFHEKNGESLIVKGRPLSKALESNYIYNK